MVTSGGNKTVGLKELFLTRVSEQIAKRRSRRFLTLETLEFAAQHLTRFSCSVAVAAKPNLICRASNLNLSAPLLVGIRGASLFDSGSFHFRKTKSNEQVTSVRLNGNTTTSSRISLEKLLMVVIDPRGFPSIRQIVISNRVIVQFYKWRLQE